jgi:hypothetical protein
MVARTLTPTPDASPGKVEEPRPPPSACHRGARPVSTATFTKRKTMKAAVVQEFGKPLRIEEVPVPEPGTGE